MHSHHHHASLRTTALEEPATHPLNLSLNINKLKWKGHLRPGHLTYGALGIHMRVIQAGIDIAVDNLSPGGIKKSILFGLSR